MRWDTVCTDLFIVSLVLDRKSIPYVVYVCHHEAVSYIHH